MRNILATLLCAAALFAADAPRRAPGFALTDTKSQMHDLADYHGKIVILEFMQSTCPHCAALVGILDQIQQKYRDKVAILAVGNPPVDTPNTLAQFVAGHKITYPVLLDCGQVAYSYVQLPSFDLPQMFLIDANGMIKSHFAYSPITRDIFEGNGLMPEVDRLVSGGGASQQKAAPPKKK